MSWFFSILVATLTGVAGLFASGWVTSLHADWHRLPNREGSVGYLVVFMALLGGIAFFVAGLLLSRWVAAGEAPGFFKALLWGLGSVAACTGLALLVSRLSADIPPTLDGRELFLEVEILLPVGREAPVVTDVSTTRVGLGSVSGGTRRAYQTGPLFLEKARQENGRWILPGEVELFTSRGQRSLEFHAGEECLGRFFVPLPGRPGVEFENWSGWFPQPRPGDPPWPETQASFRFRLRKSDDGANP